MYNTNRLTKLAKSLESFKVELDSPFKNELFRSHINAARDNLLRAGELLGKEDLPNSWSLFLADKVGIILILLVSALILLVAIGLFN